MSALRLESSVSKEGDHAAGGTFAAWSGGVVQAACAVPFIRQLFFPTQVRDWVLLAEVLLTSRAARVAAPLLTTKQGSLVWGLARCHLADDVLSKRCCGASIKLQIDITA